MADNATLLKSNTTSNVTTNFQTFPLGSLTQANGDTVQIAVARKGWKIMRVEVLHDGTASYTVSVGDAGSAGRFINAWASSAATGLTAISNVPANVGYTYTADTNLVLTIGGAGISGKAHAVTVYYQVVRG